MSLFSLSFAGGGFILIGAWESLTSSTSSSSSSPTLPLSPPFSSLSSPSSSLSTPIDKVISHQLPHRSHSNPPSQHHHPRFSTVTLIATAFLSLLFFINSLLALIDAHRSNDSIGTALQLQSLAVSSLFIFFSLLGLANNLSSSLSFPYPLTNLILFFSFVEEFLVFYLQIKDSSGVENRYFTLMLIPISICVFSTVLDMKSPDSSKPRLARGIGMVLQGTWLIQMGFSFYTDWLANNCDLKQRSWGNYTIRCKGHMDDHRGKAIAVLLFNCHLAFLVAVIAGVYSVVSGGKGNRNYSSYRPLGAELQMGSSQSQFTLDSEDEEEDGNVGGRGKQEVTREVAMENGGDSGGVAVQLRVNGH